MKVLTLTTWENPKDDEGLKKYYGFIQKDVPAIDERRKKYNVKSSSWSDGTGKMFMIDEFNSYEDYVKYTDDAEFQKMMIHFFRLVNNANTMILREGISAQP
jgi:hypothetical protein